MAGERILLFLFFSFNFFGGGGSCFKLFPPPRENVHKVKEFKCFSALIVLIIQHPRGSRKKGEWNTLNLILLRSLSFSLFYKNQSRLKDTSLLTFCSLVGFLSGRANVVSWVWMWLGGANGSDAVGPWLENSEQGAPEDFKNVYDFLKSASVPPLKELTMDLSCWVKEVKFRGHGCWCACVRAGAL